MKIENEIRLDFKHVLIKPKRSSLISRSEVDLNREFIFLHSGKKWNGIPIIAANMDTVGTMDMANALSNHNMCTALHKHYKLDQLVNFYKGNDIDNRVFYSMGVSHNDLEKLELFCKKYKAPELLCIDVANGYSDIFVDFVARMRDKFPDTIIMAGNVVTSDIVYELVSKGVDIVKVGIGPGCFIPGSLVMTKRGLVPIENVEVGDEVITHKGRWREVTNTMNFDDKKGIVKVNGIGATLNHEFYVVHKKYAELVTDDNIEEYAEWVEAKSLTKEYMAVEYDN